ncbi:MAG: hypothetical protein C0501_06230 [Isosphaera sp.]|nr:hypothetical protein [Isosphaera sp.]
MRVRTGAVIAGLLLAPAPGRADVGFPGLARVANDKVIEVAGDTAGYRFWLVSPRGPEPLDLAPGRPARVDGRGRDGSHRQAFVLAVPVGAAGQPGSVAWDAVLAGKVPPGVLQSGPLDFSAAVPVLDPRGRITDHYRLEFVPGERVELVWLGVSTTDRLMSVAWWAVGVGVAGLVVWGGLRLACRGRRAPAET